MAKAEKSTKKVADSRAADREAYFPLGKLQLDKDNPRFGLLESSSSTQADILDHIVEKFGVDEHPAFPAPSDFRGRRLSGLGQIVPREYCRVTV